MECLYRITWAAFEEGKSTIHDVGTDSKATAWSIREMIMAKQPEVHDAQMYYDGMTYRFALNEWPRRLS